MSAATPTPVAELSPEEQALEKRREVYREQLALQQKQIVESEASVEKLRAERKRMIIGARRPLEGRREGLLSYDEMAVLLSVSKSAVYKMARGGWEAPTLHEQGV